MLIGTLVNTAAILVGSLLGLLGGKFLPTRVGDAVMKGLGLCTLYIGISGMLEGQNTLITILSMVFGALIGELCNLDALLKRFADKLEGKFSKAEGKTSLAEGFVTSSLIFCVGAMAIVGALQDGLNSDHTLLFAKATMDFISSIIFASTLGVGVLFSAGTVFVLQGSIALLASVLAPVLSATVVAEMTCVGSLLIFALALNILGITKFKVMNYVPAIFLPIVLCLFL